MPPEVGVPTSFTCTPGSALGSVLVAGALLEHAGSRTTLTAVAMEMPIRRCLAFMRILISWGGDRTSEPGLATAPGVEEVAQPVTEQVEGEDRQGERTAREDHHPRRY